MKFKAIKVVGLFVVCSHTAFGLLANPAYAQTQEEMDGATKILGRPQTKTSALSFWAGFAEGKKYYDKAADYYANMQKLYELDFGPLNGRVAWAMAKRANCLGLQGKNKEAAELSGKCQEMIESCMPTAKDADRVYLVEAQKVIAALPKGAGDTEAASSSKLPDYEIEAQRGLDAIRSKQPGEAVKHLSAALKLAPPKCDIRALLLNSLSLAELDTGMLDSAFAHTSEALKFAKENPKEVNPLDLAGSYRNMGAIYLRQKKLKESESMLNVSAVLLKEIEPTKRDARILWLMELAQERSVRSDLLKAMGKSKEADSEIAKLKAELVEHEKLMRELGGKDK